MLPLYNCCTVDGSHFIDSSRLHSNSDCCILHSGNGCMVWSTGKLYDDCVISIGQLCKQLSRSPIVADCFCVVMTKISSIQLLLEFGHCRVSELGSWVDIALRPSYRCTLYTPHIAEVQTRLQICNTIGTSYSMLCIKVQRIGSLMLKFSRVSIMIFLLAFEQRTHK